MRIPILAALLALVVLLLSGCGGDGSPSELLPPSEFSRAVAGPETVTLNVHVPDEGAIPGSDLAIPYDELEARQDELPPRSTPLAVYCRSGRMSASAVQTLARLGYEDLVELEGGMEAWRADGLRLLPPGAS